MACLLHVLILGVAMSAAIGSYYPEVQTVAAVLLAIQWLVAIGRSASLGLWWQALQFLVGGAQMAMILGAAWGATTIQGGSLLVAFGALILLGAELGKRFAGYRKVKWRERSLLDHVTLRWLDELVPEAV